MRILATVKPVITMKLQTSLVILFVLEIYDKPWIEDVCKNSLKIPMSSCQSTGAIKQLPLPYGDQTGQDQNSDQKLRFLNFFRAKMTTIGIQNLFQKNISRLILSPIQSYVKKSGQNSL